MSFWRDPSCQFETPTWNFYQEVYQQKWYRKRILIALLEESREEYLQASLQADSALMRHHEQNASGTQKIKMTTRKGHWAISPDSRASHHTSRQLGTTADWRYDIPWNWLRNACQMARVRWGTHCEGFRSEEGAHYRIEQSAWNQLEHFLFVKRSSWVVFLSWFMMESPSWLTIPKTHSGKSIEHWIQKWNTLELFVV